jgi:hypothetical protein
MGSLILFALLVVVIGLLFLVALRKSGLASQYRDESENEGPWLERRAARYLRKRSLLEALFIVAGAAVLIFIQFKWGVGLF